MIPDYQSLMRPVLESAVHGEVSISNVVDQLANKLSLNEEDRNELLPSGKQTRFANRVHWAKSYLKQAGLVKATKRGHFELTQRGHSALTQSECSINKEFLEQFSEFQEFQARTKSSDSEEMQSHASSTVSVATPDEDLRAAHAKINDALASEILDRVRQSAPAFFENTIVELLTAMGYGGTSEDAGRAIGKSGDDGVDGVIDQDPLGVDQIYIQAKRYAEGNKISAGALRDFFGALSLKKAQKGIFVTTSDFSEAAIRTANDLGSRIVLINGRKLSYLLLRYEVGCRTEEVLHIKKIDEDFFDAE